VSVGRQLLPRSGPFEHLGVCIEQFGIYQNLFVHILKVKSLQRDDTRNLDIRFVRSGNRTALIQAAQTVRQLCQRGQHHTDHSPAHTKLLVEEIRSANLRLQMRSNRRLAKDNSSDDRAWATILQTSMYRCELLGRTISHPNSRGFHPSFPSLIQTLEFSIVRCPSVAR